MNNQDQIINVINELARQDFIVFAGAGIPKATGTPTWLTLLEKLIALKKSQNNYLARINLDDITPREYPDIAQRVFDALKAEGKEDEYYRAIEENIKPTHSPYSAEQLEIVTTSNWVVTTNFDTTFESAFYKKFEIKNKFKSLKIQSLPDFTFQDFLAQESIVYLHGKADEKFIIFKKEDYENYYPSYSKKPNTSKDVEDYVKFIYRQYRIVFLGFSFDDEYFTHCLKSIYEDVKRSDAIAATKQNYVPSLSSIKHYAFLRKLDYGNNAYLLHNLSKFDPISEDYKKAKALFDFEELISELESINIKVIPYKNHIDWQNHFKKIREIRNSLKE